MKKDIYKKIAKDVINAEIISLNKLKNSLDLNFKKAVEKILNCKKGKVILSGVGKSGIIAKKIASKSSLTLSVGKRAFYQQSEMTLGEAYAYTAKIMVDNMLKKDAKEGISAFLTKRKPQWQDK